MKLLIEQLKCYSHFEAYVLELDDQDHRLYESDEAILMIIDEDDDHFAHAIMIRAIDYSSDCVDCIEQDEVELDDQDEEI